MERCPTVSGEIDAGEVVVAPDDFELLECLSIGPRAELWRAIDCLTACEVVIKILERGRVVDGAGAAITRAGHPNIVRVLSHGTIDDGRAYVALERVEGVQLRRMVAGLPLRDARPILAELAHALAFAHALGIAHGALSPEHIMLAAADDEHWCAVRLLGFGTCMPDPLYAAPEQLCGERADARSDVFALAALAVEMLTGVGPFSSLSVSPQGALEHRLAGMIPLIALPADLTHLRPILSRALRSGDRPTLDELASALTGERLARGSAQLMVPR